MRSWWGWGRVDQALDGEQMPGARRERVGRLLPLDGAVTPVPDGSTAAAGPNPARRRRWPPSSPRTTTTGRRTPTARRTATSSGRCRAASTTHRTWSPARVPSRRVALLDWAGDGRGRRRPLRRRHLGRRRRRVPRWRSVAVPGPDRPGRCHRRGRGQPRRRIGRRRSGPPWKRAATARPDPAAFPAELRVLHRRRLGGHPRRRPLRHRPDPHRRPRQSLRVVTPVGINETPRVPARCRARAGPAVPRLRGHTRRDNRGVAAGPASPALHGRGRDALRARPDGRAAVRAIASPGCNRPTAGCSTRSRRRSAPA